MSIVGIVQERARLACFGLLIGLMLTLGCSRDPATLRQRYLEAGRRDEREGRLAEAVAQFNRAVTVDGKSSEAHVELSAAYRKLGQPADAYREVLEAVELDPADVRARLLAGELQLAYGMPDRALTQVEAVLAIQPNDAEAYALAADVAAQEHRPDEAVKQIERALALTPNRAAFHTRLAELELGDAGLDSTNDAVMAGMAEQELRRAIALDNHDAAAHRLLGTLLERKNDIPGAEREMGAAVRLAPADLQARRDLAGISLRAGDVTRAEQTLRAATVQLSGTPEGALALSEFYLSRGELVQADSAYAALVRENPRSFDLRYAYARILIAEHRDAEAAKLQAALAKERPDSPEATVLEAELLVNAGKASQAYELLQQANHAKPNNQQLLIAFARVAEVQEDYVTAEVNLHAAQKLTPGDLAIEGGLADIAIRKHDDPTLAQLAEETLARNPVYPEAYLWRGMAEADEEEYDRAENDLKTVLAKDPGNDRAPIVLGRILLGQGRIEPGLGYLERAVDARPKDLEALGVIVQYDLNSGHPEKAIARLQQQVDRDPQNPELLTALARIELQNHQLAAARGAAQGAVGMAPDDGQARRVYVECLVAGGETESAIGTMKLWLDRHPTDAQAVTLLGQLEESEGHGRMAMNLYWKALSLEPHEPLASNSLAGLLLVNGSNRSVALRLAQDAHGALPDWPAATDTLGWIYYWEERYLSARDLLEEAVRDDPSNAKAQYHLGMTCRRLGDKTAAALHLKKAISLAPGSDSGKAAAEALMHPG